MCGEIWSRDTVRQWLNQQIYLKIPLVKYLRVSTGWKIVDLKKTSVMQRLLWNINF